VAVTNRILMKPANPSPAVGVARLISRPPALAKVARLAYL
jgi:hypothetical protein